MLTFASVFHTGFHCSLQSQASDETVGTPSHKVSKSSKASESPRIHQDSAFQETINNCNNRLNMRSPTSGFADSLHPLTPTSPTSGNVSKAESIGRPNSGYISPSIVRVYAPVKKQSSVNDDKSDVDDEDDDIEEVLRTEESVADDAVDQTVDSEQSLGLDYVEEVQPMLSHVPPTRAVNN
ncbi:unnamed protein product [Heterobilharzia americana]|nr:unnamed protein product [Heterobilharzia americana]